jgi:hypothetical protein
MLIIFGVRPADYSSKGSYHLWKMIVELNKTPGFWMGWKSHCKKIFGEEYVFCVPQASFI